MIELDQLTLEEKIAQMLMIGFRGLSISSDAPIHSDIVERGIGGVVLFDQDVPSRSSIRNIASPEQLKELTAYLQAIAKPPLLIAVDQEGGQVARLKPMHGFPHTVSHAQLGEHNCLTETKRQASLIAETLNQCGVNLNFAPCVDVNVNPFNPIIAKKERSFSHDPQRVVSHAIEFIKAHHAQCVLTTLKHFPGHGSSRDDSHHGFVDITTSWWPEEVLPYEKIIGLGLADAIMTGHVFHAKLDEAYPATLSEKIISDKLRTDMGYSGVVFSDDLQMQAISNVHGFENGIYRTIRAGVDILLFGNNSEYDEQIADKAIKTVMRLFKVGHISVDRIDQSVQRILTLKSKLKKAP